MILGIGGVVIDRSLVIPDIPGWDTVLHADKYSTQQGGMVATALATSARLGVESEFIGAIGDDDAGGFIMKKFIENRVSCPRIKVMEGKPSPCSICLVNASTGTRTIIHYKGIQDYNSLDMNIDLQGMKILHIDGYWSKTALETARKAKKEGVVVMMDPSSSILQMENSRELFACVDYCISGYGFGKALTGKSDPEEICRTMYMDSMTASILTCGEHGSFIFDGKEMINIPAFPIGAVDTTGAGDVYHGAFMAGYLWGYDIRKNCIFATAAAALKCGHVGGQAGIPYKHEIFEFLKDKGYSYK